MPPSTPEKYEDTRRLLFNRKKSRKSKPLLIILFRGVLGEILSPYAQSQSLQVPPNAPLSGNFLNPYSTFHSTYKDTVLNISSQSAAVYKTNAALASTLLITDSDSRSRKNASVIDRNYLSATPAAKDKGSEQYSALLPPP